MGVIVEESCECGFIKEQTIGHGMNDAKKNEINSSPLDDWQDQLFGNDSSDEDPLEYESQDEIKLCPKCKLKFLSAKIVLQFD